MKKAFIVVSLLVSAVMLLTACGPAVTPTPVVTEPPVPTANPLGTAAMPIVMAFAPSMNSQTLTTGGQALADKLKEMTGLEFTVTVPTSYAALIEAMGSDTAQIGWLPPAAYVVAKAKGYVDLGVIALRNGADHYGFQYIVNSARDFTAYYDPTTGQNTADAATALAQFNGLRPCFADPISTSGYLVPAGLLKTSGVTYKAPVMTQGHDKTAISVYLSPNGEICDFGATYVPTPNISTTFPDYLDKLTVVYMSDPIIPNDNVSYSVTMPADMQQTITDALMSIASTDDGKALLKSIGYSWSGAEIQPDSFYDDYRVLLQSINYDFNNFAG